MRNQHVFLFAQKAYNLVADLYGSKSAVTTIVTPLSLENLPTDSESLIVIPRLAGR